MTLRNWAGSLDFSTDQLVRPSTVEELQSLVADHPRVRALGTGHSFSPVADTTGALITTAGLALPVEIDAGARTVTVGGGVRYGELAGVLEAQGWALHNLGSLPHISVAGACATGTHGSGDRNMCLAAAASRVEFVQADGTAVTVARGDSAFGGSVLALGALGIVTRMTLAIEPSYEMRQDVWLDAPVEVVASHFDEVMAAGYSVSLFTDWRRPDVLEKVWIKSRTDGALADGTAWGARAADVAQHPLTGEDASAATQQLGVSGRWHERLPHFRLEFTPSNGDEQQTEYLIPREHGPAALRALATLDLSAAIQVFEMRTVASDDLWLSPCGGRETVALHFTWVNDDARVRPVVAALEVLLEPFDPRPHWGKVFDVDPAVVRAHYPRLPDFAALAEHHDPQRKFGNAFLKTYIY